MNAIEVDHVHKAFGKITALAGVDLTVPEGGVLGLLGHNGAGKTTLVRILSTLIRPDRGSVRVCGFDAVSAPVAVRRLIGLAGQHAAVDEALTGRENLTMIGRLYRLSARRTKQLVEQVLSGLSLVAVADRPVRTYSGGLRRRLDVGASLVGTPSALLLDEPSTGLDPVSRQELWVLIKDLAAAGTSVLLTTQQLEEADYLAGDIVVLNQGRVVAHGSPTALKARLGHQTVTVTLAERTEAERAIDLLSAVGGEISTDAATVTIRTPEAGGLARAVRILDEANIGIVDVGVRAPSLEDVYLSVTSAAEVA